MVCGCAVWRCTNRASRHSRVSFHRFPADPERRKKWAAYTGNPTFVPSKYSALCSDHFKDSDFVFKIKGNSRLKKDAVPSVYHYYAPPVQEECQSEDGKRKLKIEDSKMSASTSFSSPLKRIKTEKEEFDEEYENPLEFCSVPIDESLFIKPEPDSDLHIEQIIVKEELFDEEPSTSETKTEICEADVDHLASGEVGRLLSQLGPQKRIVRGMSIDTTDAHVLQFTVTLLRGKTAPRIWRRFQVPGNYTFRQFHIAIQKVMGWESSEIDYHLHAFHVVNPATGFEDAVVMAEDVQFECGSKDETLTKIRDYFTVINHKGKYEYDFGVGWEHEVVFETAFLPVEGAVYPRCVEGAKACPPEDGVVQEGAVYDPDEFDPKMCF